MRVLLATPPMTQLNTPYPATAYLTGFLRAHAMDLELEVCQADASLALFLRLFSAAWLARMAQYFLHDIVMRLWPVPAFAQLPAIENVANQIERVALMGAQKIEQVIRLTARCSEVDVRDPDGAIVMLIVALGHRYAILPPELRY